MVTDGSGSSPLLIAFPLIGYLCVKYYLLIGLISYERGVCIKALQ